MELHASRGGDIYKVPRQGIRLLLEELGFARTVRTQKPITKITPAIAARRKLISPRVHTRS